MTRANRPAPCPYPPGPIRQHVPQQDKGCQVGLINRKNKWLTDAAARLLDGPAAILDGR